jgi:sugar/nucleoside kinase (ribokinase family)
MKNRLDVLAVADICVDLMLTGNVRPQFHQVEQLVDDYALELGGSACIFATQFVRLGGLAGVVGWTGPDMLGDFVLTKLRDLSVDTAHVRRHPEIKTGLGVALAEPGDRAILTYLGTIDAVQREDLSDDLFSATRHWHIASYFLLGHLRMHWPEWLRRCRAANLTTSLDTNWDPAEGWEGVTELLPWIDVFLPNEAEAIAISDEMDLQTAGEKLASYGPLVVIKRGAEGAAAFQGGRRWAARAETVDASSGLVDQVGAGDNFDAGFLRGWLLGLSVDECLNLGCRCARSSLFAAGGIAAQLTEDIQPDMKRKGQRLE